MKLVKVEILNYRSIKEATVEFEPTCRVLVGINESGKSNVLRALSFLSEDVKPDRTTDVRESLPNENEVAEAHVKFFFRLDRSECNNVFDLVAQKVLSNRVLKKS